MKMVKSLLLGSAAGVVAMAGAQAADLPVKAKPVQYVKICSLYGAGFYYVPGTDMCMKIGGWIRQQITLERERQFVNHRPEEQNTQTRGTTDGPPVTAATSPRMRVTRPNTARSAAISRSASVRRRNGSGADLAAGSAPGFSANRAFIQFAGFTLGMSQSFFDFYLDRRRRIRRHDRRRATPATRQDV